MVQTLLESLYILKYPKLYNIYTNYIYTMKHEIQRWNTNLVVGIQQVY